MGLWGFFLGAFVIGFSGAMMPGPMLGITIDGSLKKGWKAGPLIVLGHGILELLLVIIMLLGFRDFFSDPMVAGVTGLLGGTFLARMGYGMIKSGASKSVSLESQRAAGSGGVRNLTLEGALVSATNPYFIIWWVSTGMESIRQSYSSGLLGVMSFFTGHILSDFVWYTAISIAFSGGRKLISDAVYRWVIIALGVFIIAFSVFFIGSGWKILFGSV